MKARVQGARAQAQSVTEPVHVGPNRSTTRPTAHPNPKASVACRDQVKIGQSRPTNPPPQVPSRARAGDPIDTIERRRTVSLRLGSRPNHAPPPSSFSGSHTPNSQPLSTSTPNRDARTYIFQARAAASHSEADTARRPDRSGVHRSPSFVSTDAAARGRRPAVLHHLGPSIQLLF